MIFYLYIEDKHKKHLALFCRKKQQIRHFQGKQTRLSLIRQPAVNKPSPAGEGGPPRGG